mmetsp:Transcript_3546/g.5894  ORF Transcript_3546/g.5894 Transcript_3546/m.5894 type:complete len:86 (-) Transcript_3546:944-1201(-)
MFSIDASFVEKKEHSYSSLMSAYCPSISPIVFSSSSSRNCFKASGPPINPFTPQTNPERFFSGAKIRALANPDPRPATSSVKAGI